MTRKWMKYGAALFLAAAVVFVPQLQARADVQGAAEWNNRNLPDGVADLSLQLVPEHEKEVLTAFQVDILLTVSDVSSIKEVSFTFDDSRWEQCQIVESVYDETAGRLSLIVANGGRDEQLPFDGKTKIGRMTVKSSEDVEAVIENAEAVEDGELKNIASVHGARITLKATEEPETKPTDPSEPETKPSEPETKPSEPETKPSEPETKPSEPETKPSEPETKPSEPETKPSEPETKPSEPETKPSEPETKPSSPSYTVSGSHSSSSRPLGGYTSPQATAVETVGRWLKSGDYWKFILPTGASASNTWVYVKGLWYHMGSGGLMNTGWYLDNGTWYYLDPVDGDMKTGWRLVNNRWYYLEPGTGKMQTGWKELDGVWYYLNAVNGDMATGWLKDGDQWYYLKANGDMATGWLQIGGKWYYFHTQSATKENQKLKGSMYAGEKTPDGHTVNALGERQ